MELTINGKDYKLNFGVKFATLLDESELFKAEGIEFGIGLAVIEEKLKMGSLSAVATVLECALHRSNVTENKIYEFLDEYAEEDKLNELLDQLEKELKNSKAVQFSQVLQKKMTREASRRSSAVEKLTKK